MEQVACKNCICYVELPNTNGQGGECHRNPPSVVVISKPKPLAGTIEQTINTVFPPVPAANWCMQFQPKPVAGVGLPAGSA